MIFASVAFRSSQAEAVLARKLTIHVSIVLVGIWVFFCGSYAPVVLVRGQKSDLHIYICVHITYVYIYICIVLRIHIFYVSGCSSCVFLDVCLFVLLGHVPDSTI